VQKVTTMPKFKILETCQRTNLKDLQLSHKSKAMKNPFLISFPFIFGGDGHAEER